LQWDEGKVGVEGFKQACLVPGLLSLFRHLPLRPNRGLDLL
jgi:hypothetical protein